MRRALKYVFITFLFFSSLSWVFANDENPKAPVFVGEFFGVKIPAGNYIFIRNTIAIFGNKWGPQPQTPEDLEKVIWDQLLMSFEAFRRGIAVTQEEIDEEIGKILAAEKIEFDWKKDKDAYEEWVKNKTNEPAEIFEGQIRHLIQLNKLRKTVMESFNPPVSRKEAYQEFLNEHNSLSVELVQFEDKKKALIFYKKARSYKDFWEKEKEKRPKDFKRPGNVSLEFLIDIWGFDRKAAYGMMRKKEGDIYPPAPIYKGYAVFKILGKRHADKSYFKKKNVRKSYYQQIKNRKRLKAFHDWFEDLKKQANIRKYDKVINALSKGETSQACAAEKEN